MSMLTDHELRTLNAIAEFRATHRYCPTAKDLADARGCSTRTIRQHLTALVNAGRVRMQPGTVRTIVDLPEVQGGQ